MGSGKLYTLQSLVLALLLCVAPIHAQSGDGGSAEGFSNSNLGGGNGADGTSNSSANLSKGAIIAIAVVVALVVFGGITLAVLFYLAKKRQWQVRQTIRRTTTRVVRAMTPRTPAKMTFGSPRSPGPNKVAFGDKNKRPRHGDIEKGFQSIDQQLLRSSEESKTEKNKHIRSTSGEDSNKTLSKSKPKPTIAVPSSDFEIDSPKSPFLNRVFGRK